MTDIVVPIFKGPEHEDLPYPSYASEAASGLDLHAAVAGEVVVRPGDIVLVPTGIAVAIPPGFEGQVRARSGLALRHGLILVNGPGTIDADYRGEIGVILTTLKNEPFVIERGMRIAQLVFAPVARARLEPADELPASVRGTGGFGHTGLRQANA